MSIVSEIYLYTDDSFSFWLCDYGQTKGILKRKSLTNPDDVWRIPVEVLTKNRKHLELDKVWKSFFKAIDEAEKLLLLM